jgi:hypothetical protein
MDDQRDYEEEYYVRLEMEKLGVEESRLDFLESLDLDLREHEHGIVNRGGRYFALECIECHDEEECDGLDCLWCSPA